MDDAHKLQGKFLLMFGELDHNVDPVSMTQFVNALENTNKDFEMLVVTGSDHGAAEMSYGSKRRMDFFVRNLLGVEPPSFKKWFREMVFETGAVGGNYLRCMGIEFVLGSRPIQVPSMAQCHSNPGIGGSLSCCSIMRSCGRIFVTHNSK